MNDDNGKMLLACVAIAITLGAVAIVVSANGSENAPSVHTDYIQYDMEYELHYYSIEYGQLSTYELTFDAPADGYVSIRYNTALENQITFHKGENSLMFYRSTTAVSDPILTFYIAKRCGI